MWSAAFTAKVVEGIAAWDQQVGGARVWEARPGAGWNMCPLLNLGLPVGGNPMFGAYPSPSSSRPNSIEQVE